MHFFICYLADPRPNVGHYQGDSLINPMLLTELFPASTWSLPMRDMGLKLPWYYNSLLEKPLGHYFQVRSPYYLAAQCNQKTTIHV